MYIYIYIFICVFLRAHSLLPSLADRQHGALPAAVREQLSALEALVLNLLHTYIYMFTPPQKLLF